VLTKIDLMDKGTDAVDVSSYLGLISRGSSQPGELGHVTRKTFCRSISVSRLTLPALGLICIWWLRFALESSVLLRILAIPAPGRSNSRRGRPQLACAARRRPPSEPPSLSPSLPLSVSPEVAAQREGPGDAARRRLRRSHLRFPFLSLSLSMWWRSGRAPARIPSSPRVSLSLPRCGAAPAGPRGCRPPARPAPPRWPLRPPCHPPSLSLPLSLSIWHMHRGNIKFALHLLFLPSSYPFFLCVV